MTVEVVRYPPPSKWTMRVVPPPSRVTEPPPSRVVSFPLGNSSCAVSLIVVGAPQLKVTTPPFLTAATSAASVHPPLPLPTTVVGVEVSAAPNGRLHARAAGTEGASMRPGGDAS